MFITQITSYGNAWSTFEKDFPELKIELMQAIEAIKVLLPDSSRREDKRIYNSRKIMETLFASDLERLNWKMINHRSARVTTSGLSIRGVGQIKNGIAARFHYHHEIFNRWLYTIAPLATKNEIVTLPIAVMLAERDVSKHDVPVTAVWCDRITSELEALQPLSYSGPFIIIGVSDQQKEVVITELTSNSSNHSKDVLINRSLEFPPEHHQAGLGILSYFGTILRDKYPGTKAKVRIEQEGLLVRLIIESSDGNREIIEKALEDYELVVRGEKAPEEFLDDKLKILELRQEIRFAELRIRQQEDMIQFHREQILSLTTLFGHSLSRAPSPVTIDFKPSITVNSTASNLIEISLSEALDELSNLSALSAGDPPLQLKILDLHDSLAQLENTTSVPDAKNSSGLSKLKAFIEDASKTGTSANNMLKVVEGGIDTLQSLARKYNSLAEWCGAPQVPRVFIGSEE